MSIASSYSLRPRTSRARSVDPRGNSAVLAPLVVPKPKVSAHRGRSRTPAVNRAAVSASVVPPVIPLVDLEPSGFSDAEVLERANEWMDSSVERGAELPKDVLKTLAHGVSLLVERVACLEEVVAVQEAELTVAKSTGVLNARMILALKERLETLEGASSGSVLGPAVSSSTFDHKKVVAFHQTLSAFQISGDSASRVWEFIMTARQASKLFCMDLYDASILGPRFATGTPAAAWFLQVVVGAAKPPTVAQALDLLAVRFKEDVNIIEREARLLRQGESQKVAEWRAQVDVFVTRWYQAAWATEKELAPHTDQVVVRSLLDRTFAQHGRRIYSDGLRAEFAAALVPDEFEARHRLALDIEERNSRVTPLPSVSTVLKKPTTEPDLMTSLSALVQSLARQVCFFCGKEGHFARECPDRGSKTSRPSGAGVKCFQCGKLGHLKRSCPSRGATPAVSAPTNAVVSKN